MDRFRSVQPWEMAYIRSQFDRRVSRHHRTFDDFRAEEAFRLFSEMAQTGQVIDLTRHQHLCEIVRRVCPSARLHRLDEPEMQRRIA